MRFLKNKIFRAQKTHIEALEIASKDEPEPQEALEINITVSNTDNSDPIRRTRAFHNEERKERQKGEAVTKENDAVFKNLAINYGKAIAGFAASHLAIPYLEKKLESISLTREEFIDFINSHKRKIGGISSLRSMLLIIQYDDERTKACKKLFQWAGEVFIKNFSVNWIMHGRMAHKLAYLKFRFKMLRRIKDPESFTYIKLRTCKTESH